MNNEGFLNHFSKRDVKKQTVAFVLSVLVSCLALLLFHFQFPVNLLTSSDFSIQSFADKWENGNSTGQIDKKTVDEISYSYVLEKGLLFPYAGLLFEKQNHSNFDLSNKILVVQIQTNKKQRLPIRIFNYQDGLSDIKNVNSYRLFEKVYPLDSGYNKLEVSFNEFTNTPEWWYTVNNFKETDTKEIDHSHVKHISFFSDPEIPINIKQSFKITKIELKGDYTGLYFKISIFVSSIVVLFFLYQLYVYLKNKRIHLSLKYSDDFEHGKNQSKGFENQIRNYFSENYTNSELKAADLADYLKIPEYKISEVLKDNVNMSFKGFLNLTRVEAAKLYLKSSNYSISEIAYKTGFNSPSSFNRVFKDVTSISPGEFKEQA